MSLPLSNYKVTMTTAEGGPLARSTALRHPTYKNIRMGGGRSGKSDTFIFLYKTGGGFKNYPFSGIVLCLGPLTQVAEYLPFKQRVAGSNPARPTNFNAE